jgi:23S rRNA-/tRNA-specific pseudouridylate synthase
MNIMQRILIVAAFFAIGGLFSCKAQETKTTDQKTEIPVEANKTTKDTPAKYKRVIFFALSSTELMELESKDPSAVEATNDFDFYVNEFMTNPGRNDLEILYNDKESIVLEKQGEQFFFERKSQAEPFGIILTDGVKDPVIKSGIFAAEQYKTLCDEYFGK